MEIFILKNQRKSKEAMINITKISNNRGNAETVIKNTHKKMANLPKILNIYPIDKTIMRWEYKEQMVDKVIDV